MTYFQIVLKQSSPCSPSPCGPNSQCREQDDRPICSCLSNYNGAPPNCRPECVYNSECSLDTACVNLKCIDTCLGACGFNSECRMVNHNPICSCPKGFSGDPFLQCQKIRKLSLKNFYHVGCLQKFCKGGAK